MLRHVVWIKLFLSKSNGRVMFREAREAFDIYVDASLTGMGACWNENAYAVSCHILATVKVKVGVLRPVQQPA